MSRYFDHIKTAEPECILSIKDSLEQALQVFVQGSKLTDRWESLVSDSQFVIAETAFGYGHHFLMVWQLWKQYAPASARLTVISAVSSPLDLDHLAQYWAIFPNLHQEATELIANYPILTSGFHLLQFDGGRIRLILMIGDPIASFNELLVCGDPSLEQVLRHYQVDAWFLNDAHSDGSKDSLLTVMGMLSKTGTTAILPVASEAIKLSMQIAGFSESQVCIERGSLFNYTQVPKDRFKRQTPWHHHVSSKKNSRKTAIVLGGGLSGCYIAYALASKGFSVSVLERHSRLGQGASGNQQAILYPKLSAFYSPLNAYMLNSYLFAIRQYRVWLQSHAVGDLSGMLQLAYHHKEQIVQDHLKSWLTHYPSLGAIVDAKDASAIAGIPLSCQALFLPHSGWINSPALCEVLIQHQGITCALGTSVEALYYEQGEWHVNEHHAEVLVIANGYEASSFEQTKHLPLKAIRGQMTAIASNHYSECLKVPLCAGAHIIPAQEGRHCLGATYHSGTSDSACYESDDDLNLAKLQAFPTTIPWSDEVLTHWTGIRAATPDYLPLVGPVLEPNSFRACFAGLSTNSKRWVPECASHHDGLFVFTGFGSRGLTTIPLSAESLASMINKEPIALPRTMQQALSPSRFLRKEIISNTPPL